MSALAPEVGDRYRLGEDEWQVAALEAGHKAAGPRSEHRAQLRRAVAGKLYGSIKRAGIQDLLFGAWVYLGNFLPPAGFLVRKIGAHWYYRTPAGNVHGAAQGVRWTEADVLREARAAAAAADLARACRA